MTILKFQLCSIKILLDIGDLGIVLIWGMEH